MNSLCTLIIIILWPAVKEWKPSRQVFKAALNPTILFDSFMDTFNRRNEELVTRLKAEVGTGQQFDLWPYLFPTSVSMIRRKLKIEVIENKNFLGK